MTHEARDFLLAALAGGVLFEASPAWPVEPVQVPQYGLVEIATELRQPISDPFGDSLLIVEAVDPAGKMRRIEGFFDGDGNGGPVGNIWKVRLCPDVPGIWRWRIISPGVAEFTSKGIEGQLECTASEGTGPLVARGRYFELAGAGPFYLVGNFLDHAHGFRSTHTLLAESTTEAQRTRIFDRQRDLHDVNFINFYLANRGDYAWQSVTPWVGDGKKSDKTRFDLSRWKMFEEWIERAGQNGMLVCLWFFADDSGFGKLSRVERERFLRYAMARTSAFHHTFYILGLEYQEAFPDDVLRDMGDFLADHNPWERLVSTHLVGGEKWSFSGDAWADFIASQVGNQTTAERVNGYVRKFRRENSIPDLHMEFGILRADYDVSLVQRTWANFCGGAAGGGCGSGLKSLQRFLRESRVPFQRMSPSNDLVDQGGMMRFCLAEPGHHYVVYSMSGNPRVRVKGENLRGVWFDPANVDAKLEPAFPVAPGDQELVSPDPTRDWVLWITDGSNLNSGRTHQGVFSPIVRVNVPAEAMVHSR